MGDYGAGKAQYRLKGTHGYWGFIFTGASDAKNGRGSNIRRAIAAINGYVALVALIVIYVLTLLFTEVITNNAAAVLMFPIAVTVANRLGVDFLPYIIAIIIAAPASFLFPFFDIRSRPTGSRKQFPGMPAFFSPVCGQGFKLVSCPKLSNTSPIELCIVSYRSSAGIEKEL